MLSNRSLYLSFLAYVGLQLFIILLGFYFESYLFAASLFCIEVGASLTFHLEFNRLEMILRFFHLIEYETDSATMIEMSPKKPRFVTELRNSQNFESAKKKFKSLIPDPDPNWDPISPSPKRRQRKRTKLQFK